MSILKQLGFTLLLCASGAATIAPSMAHAQSNWSFEYTYEGISTINYVNGGSQTVNIAPGPFTTARTLGAGYTWTKLSSFNSNITVTATWTGSGNAPSEQVFKIDSVTSIYGSSGYSGDVDNGLGHAGVQFNANTLTASGQKWIVEKPNSEGKVNFNFSVSATSMATPVPPPFGFAMATASNTLTVTPDTKAASWRHQVEPTYFRTVNANGQGSVNLNDPRATDARRATTFLTETILTYLGNPYKVYSFERNLFLDTYGFPNWPLSNYVLSASGPATIIDQNDHLMMLGGYVTAEDIKDMVRYNTPKTVIATATATEVLSGISRSAKLIVDFYPPQTVASKGPWETMYKHDPNDITTWDRISTIAQIAYGSLPREIEVSTELVAEHSVNITNSFSFGFGVPLTEALKDALNFEFGVEYGVSASIARSKGNGQTQPVAAPTIEGKKKHAWFVANPLWKQQIVKCAIYQLNGYTGDAELHCTRWDSPSKETAEANDALIDVVEIVVPAN